MASFHPEAIKKKAKMPNKIFDANHTEKSQSSQIWRQKSQTGNPDFISPRFSKAS